MGFPWTGGEAVGPRDWSLRGLQKDELMNTHSWSLFLARLDETSFMSLTMGKVFEDEYGVGMSTPNHNYALDETQR